MAARLRTARQGPSRILACASKRESLPTARRRAVQPWGETFMKKRSILYFIAVVAMLLAGCSADPDAESTATTDTALTQAAKDAGCPSSTKVGICELSCGKTETV